MKFGGTWVFVVAVLLASPMACGDDSSSSGAGGGGTGGASGTGGSGGAGVPVGMECVGNVVLETTAETTIDFSFRLSGLPQADVGDSLTIDVCSSEDPTCANPLATTVSDMESLATVALPMEPNGFEGYAQVSGTGVKPTVLMSAIPFIPDPANQYVYPVYDEAAFNGLFDQLFGVAPDPTKGQLLMNIANCNDLLASGVTVTLSDGTPVVYGDNGVPSSSLTATTSDGSAFGVNVTPGIVTVTGTLEGTSTVYATFTLDVRPDTLTIVYFQPTP